MQRLRLFSICSNSSQRNSIFILYNKGAVREEQKNNLPRCHAGNENRASPAETGRRGPFKKHCPLLMRGNSQGSGQTTNHLLTAANVWEFSYTASAAFSSFPRRWLFLFGYGLNLSVSLRSPASGLRLPASASCKVLHSRPAGRCPNNSSLFPPLAAVVAVALWQWQRNDYFLFAAEKSLRAFLCCFFTRGVVTSKCIKEHKCSSPVLPHSVKMCLERPAGRDKHENKNGNSAVIVRAKRRQF